MCNNPHLPTTRKEMITRGWRELDILLVTGDAYFDHPTHGAAVIGRVLEAAGYRVGIIARPQWKSSDDFLCMGRPTLFAGVTAGAVDSMLNNFTADLKKRRSDVYAPGGIGGGRPNFATLVYCNKLREVFPALPIILGGVEASTRRFAYWDYSKKSLRRSILVDSRADLLVYGPGEIQAREVADRLASGNNLEGILGTARLTRNFEQTKATVLPSFEALQLKPEYLFEQTKILERAAIPGANKKLSQKYAEGIIISEPAPIVTTQKLDSVFELPFNRRAHPSYPKSIPALEIVQWSVTSHRGCPGGCSFCALAIHQGRGVVSRSRHSILKEIEQLAATPDFKGIISDVGGPTANAYSAISQNAEACHKCKRSSCLYPKICKHLDTSHKPLLRILEDAQKIKRVKRVLLASGIRHDLALHDRDFIEQVAAKHTGGHLKVAPEHVHPNILKTMRKPSIERFEEFERIFKAASLKAKLKQYLVPYFITAFPGCGRTESAAVEYWLAGRGQRLQQVQNFIPLPGTYAAALYALGCTETGHKVFIPSLLERKRQKNALIGQHEKKWSTQS